MARSKRLINLRDTKLYNRFVELCNIKENGVQKYSFENIFKKLESEFHISENRMTKIIRKMQTTPPSEPTVTQPTLFE